MKRAWFVVALCQLSVLATASLAEDKSGHDDLRTILTGIARRGYEASVVNLETGTGTMGDVLLWSRRLLDAESGKQPVMVRDIRSADSQLQRVTRLRARTNVSNTMAALLAVRI